MFYSSSKIGVLAQFVTAPLLEIDISHVSSAMEQLVGGKRCDPTILNELYKMYLAFCI